MKEKIFDDYGVQIFIENGKYYIRYDEGGICIQYVEKEISKSDAEKAQISEKDAYEVILHAQQ